MTTRYLFHIFRTFLETNNHIRVRFDSRHSKSMHILLFLCTDISIIDPTGTSYPQPSIPLVNTLGSLERSLSLCLISSFSFSRFRYPPWRSFCMPNAPLLFLHFLAFLPCAIARSLVLSISVPHLLSLSWSLESSIEGVILWVILDSSFPIGDELVLWFSEGGLGV